jgi:Zn-dependent protease with chaperone function
MDFFDRQDRARRRTKLLVFYFAVALVLTVLALNLVFALIFRLDWERPDDWQRLWDIRLFAGVTAATTFVIFLGSVVKILELRRGGSAVAEMLGGTPVHPHTTDLEERRLLNVVEEMALASGIPVPQVYLLRQEAGINAFAAGLDTRDAAVGVTRGCLRYLNRDELQGVLAHEFSHILNGDMRLNLRLIGIINGLLVLAILGRQLLRVRAGSSRGGKGANVLPLIGLALVILGGIGVLFGRLIKSAVSRQREFLADAAAVQFTRNPPGLAGALKKIGGLAAGSRLENPKAEEASHLFFGNGLAASWLAWFATHPPLEQRIRLLDPQFDGVFPKVNPAAVEPEAAGPPRTGSAAAIGRLVPLADARSSPGVPSESHTVSAARLVAQVGAPSAGDLGYATALLERLPAELVAAAHEPLSAAGLALALVLSRNAAQRQGQLDAIEAQVRAEYFAGLPAIAAAVEALAPRDRLPLVSLALPALRELSPSQYEGFARLLEALVESDQEIDLFEYALLRLVRRHLAPHFGAETPARIVQYYALNPLLPDVAVLLSALAHQGQEDEPAAAAAFAVGARRLDPGGTRLHLLPAADCYLAQIDAALDRLALAAPAIKRQLLEGCAVAVAADGQVEVREAELIRAIADSLECPLPPGIEAGAGRDTGAGSHGESH